VSRRTLSSNSGPTACILNVAHRVVQYVLQCVLQYVLQCVLQCVFQCVCQFWSHYLYSCMLQCVAHRVVQYVLHCVLHCVLQCVFQCVCQFWSHCLQYYFRTLLYLKMQKHTVKHTQVLQFLGPLSLWYLWQPLILINIRMHNKYMERQTRCKICTISVWLLVPLPE